MDKAMKYKRSTTEQLDLYVAFVREHPEIQRSRSYQRNPQRMEYLWNLLAEKLNSVKGPIRTAKKWKETMTHRKNQVLCRQRKNRAYRTDEQNSFEQTSMEPVGEMKAPSGTDELNSFEQRSMEAVSKVEVGGTSSTDQFSSFEQRSMETVGNVFDGHANSSWPQQSEGTLENSRTEFDEESMADERSAVDKPQQHVGKIRKHRSAHKSSNTLMKETFNTLNNILKTQHTEEDDCDLYGRLLAKKLRQYTPFERQELMHEIDGLLIKRNRRPLASQVLRYPPLNSYSQ